ncbi:hypothetical protein GCM10010918_50330 [Paenibacillus radicis (ex Gao et al. 2016)]|uniref:Uncharacterized protein n=1 Tax=Paenibacillus radicis (ex Gao et al. 2016) TaxID=1737354 RepID=A0A917HQ44_9BACL|nr:hypothetical protein GCM10010918_50330 [Paenibacillus radicis (ex Gao et al. 2016)]
MDIAEDSSRSARRSWSEPFRTGSVGYEHVLQLGMSRFTTGSWTASSALPAFRKLQVKVRVKDGTLWSFWSDPKWLYIE